MSLFVIHKKGQGSYSRIVVGIALGLLALFASISLYNVLIGLPNIFENARVPLVDIELTWGLICSVALFVFLGYLICILVAGFKTGLRPIDEGGKKAVEFLVETQNELQKVSWPTRYELVGSTIVVIISVVIIGFFILGVDWVVSFFMEYIGVL
ncbi:protein translocase subunit SecE [Candidatus Kuenenia stuttgartiensis]|jgi:preprotein translocase SecE subunit|uniref:Protein translocase subunit SecE n=1 Tax=Kuenenia stuttgartiensis TaxID=174633 RepID=Q1Q134_KUEST|nr:MULTISPECIES: preprotein translocase subunit SecE [Kuenenia]MBE7547809.1 preprotein translocase subunit SecE [Planctomycetia bacterium]MBW7941059.1 preprotein translocase subunit SecE [Candidatus Kuenenia stuttgartiensis]MBZ0190166.1 preprotein translocase subunit SecE [Candidatus Kuenenia stuttgartiensis]MCF6152352.1 preprotein translocase subunit SecE [Candidatus Kuenenia stuttgartiensis]MCL4726151.1 preprotein translocase subunit SecE [Candidatus Kuenenia stuttgartiensis]